MVQRIRGVIQEAVTLEAAILIGMMVVLLVWKPLCYLVLIAHRMHLVPVTAEQFMKIRFRLKDRGSGIGFFVEM